MKKAIRSSLKIRRKILITLGVAFTIAALLFAIIGYIYETSVEQCYENLFNQTALVKKELVLQTEADSEQIKTKLILHRRYLKPKPLNHFMVLLKITLQNQEILQWLQRLLRLFSMHSEEMGL